MTGVFLRVRSGEERNTQKGRNVTTDAEIHIKAKDNEDCQRLEEAGNDPF